MQLFVVCDMEETRGPNAGYMSFEIGGNVQMSGQARFSSDAGGQVAAVEYGSIFKRTDPALFHRITDMLASAGPITITFAGKSWAFRNPKPVNIHCR